jgi:hypothetical protein
MEVLDFSLSFEAFLPQIYGVVISCLENDICGPFVQYFGEFSFLVL